MSNEDLKSHPESKDGEINLTGDYTVKIEEYFKLKETIKVLNSQLKEAKNASLSPEEIADHNNMMQKINRYRERIAGNETVNTLRDKISFEKERLELVRELIRLELLELGKEEIEKNGKKLKLKTILKELKAEKPQRSVFRHAPGQMSFYN